MRRAAALHVRLAGRLAVVALLGSTLTLAVGAAPAQAAVPVPATPGGLSRAIELPQPYVGQSICDPVAKPGVAAFRNMVLNTYRDTTSLGIVRDCGIGGQSEHKEGRAWDWGVSVSNPTQVSEVNALFSWLMRTDQYGNTYAMSRRLGIMYIIWNRHIWKAYQPSAGWQPYNGTDSHTTHVHFSFGWNGARRVTSFWDGSVAPVDYGPNGPTTAVPFRAPANIAVLRTYGATTLSSGATGTAVSVLQKGLGITADGQYGNLTAAAVSRFQYAQSLPADGVWGPDEWKALFLPPIDPFGALALARTPDGLSISGWAIDADSPSAVRTTVLVDGTQVSAQWASLDRPDIGAAYPDSGAAHGYAVVVPAVAGTHRVCSYGVNISGTPGVSKQLGCATLAVDNRPVGALENVTTTLATSRVTGWALDPDSTDPTSVTLTLDGAALTTTTANGSHPTVAPWDAYGANRGFDVALTLPEGAHNLCARATNAPGTPGADADFCRAVSVRHSPVGTLESVVQVPGGAVQVTGFAVDPDSPATVPVALTWDGTRAAAAPAALTRDDVAARYPGYGSAHGFSVSKALAVGPHTVCATAVNVAGTPGRETSLGCKAITVTHSPIGAFELLRNQPGGSTLIRGWALDPDVAAPARVALTLDGAYHRVLTADAVRTDLPAAWKAYGTGHGFTAPLTLPAGRHTVCAYPLNADGTPGTRVALGCRSVLVGTPTGTLEFASGGRGYLNVRGWVVDPDTAGPVTVTVVLDGRTVATLVAKVGRADVSRLFPGYGAAHGYAATLRPARGRHTLCTYARNVTGTPGSSVRLGCRTTTVY
ncbi:MAG: peptidoglycan-binding domain-containing protein [Mycobacteriales bacterium]